MSAAGPAAPPAGAGGGARGVVVARHGRPAEVAALAAAVAAGNPGYSVRAGAWEVVEEGGAATDFGAGPGGVAYTWLLDGRGEVWLPRGYRTQEGDGGPLPDVYRPERLSPAGREHLEALAAALEAGAVHPQIAAAAGAIGARLTARGFQGDIAGDLWRMTEGGVPPEAWTDAAAGRAALSWLIEHHAALGWSAKDGAGWEPLLPGDQLLTTAATPLRLRGRFRTWTIEDGGAAAAGASPPPGGAVRRLRYLRDTAGGCSPGFDAFRRLNLTWHPTAAERARLRAALGGRPGGETGEPDGDAPNRLNSHVLHVEASQSRTHYHPETPVGGGRAQCELYFALDRGAYGLQAPPGAPARLYTFSDRQDWSRYASTELTPGTAVFIPPGVGHRAVDAFVNVVTIPGFKPRNEIYVDRLVREAGGGAPYNAGAA